MPQVLRFDIHLLPGAAEVMNRRGERVKAHCVCGVGRHLEGRWVVCSATRLGRHGLHFSPNVRLL